MMDRINTYLDSAGIPTGVGSIFLSREDFSKIEPELISSDMAVRTNQYDFYINAVSAQLPLEYRGLFEFSDVMLHIWTGDKTQKGI